MASCTCRTYFLTANRLRVASESKPGRLRQRAAMLRGRTNAVTRKLTLERARIALQAMPTPDGREHQVTRRLSLERGRGSQTTTPTTNGRDLHYTRRISETVEGIEPKPTERPLQVHKSRTAREMSRDPSSGHHKGHHTNTGAHMGSHGQIYMTMSKNNTTDDAGTQI